MLVVGLGLVAVITFFIMSVAPASASIPSGNTTSFALGARIVDQTVLTAWNQYALPTDFAISGQANLVASSIAGHKVLAYGNGVDTQSLIDQAKSNGIQSILLDHEDLGDLYPVKAWCGVLANEQAQAYALTQAQGIGFIFGPNGKVFRNCYQQYPSMVTNADGILYQTEAIQGSDPTYFTDVHTVVQNVKARKPGITVWTEVSLNPPSNRNLSPADAEVIINTLEDGSLGAPDGILVFYANSANRIRRHRPPRGIHRFEAWLSVVQAYRATSRTRPMSAAIR